MRCFLQGKTYLYKKLSQQAPSPLVKRGRGGVSKVFGYQTSSYRKLLSLPKTHDIDALCVATLRYAQGQALETGEVIEHHCENFYRIKFRPRQTRRRFYDLPRKGVVSVRYQVNTELSGFRKGDIVRVNGK